MGISALNVIMQGGITPLYGFSQISERAAIDTDIKSIYKFLLDSGLDDLPTDVFDSVADSVYRNVTGKRLLMREAYESANRGQSRDASRVQMAYYLKKSYSDIRAAVLREYGYDIGKDYIGNKNFVYKLGTVYTVFVYNAKMKIYGE